ncbi:MAG: hypothetical protein RJA70_3234 [Pseudomonadota bacterium]
MIDLKGKRVLVTGATAGIGKETALGLARLGAQVIIVGRNPEKTAGVVEELKQQSGNQQIEFLLADLSSMAEVRKLAADFLAKYSSLNVLVNNAGGMNPKRVTTAEGYELTFAMNHLSYFLLANLLLPALEAGGPSRIVNVASDAHRSGVLDLDDLMSTKSYSTFGSYGASKRANILFTREMARRLEGKPITVNCLHPGFLASNFMDKPGSIWGYLKPVAYLFALDNAAGAKTSIYLASAPQVEGVSGKYFAKCKEKQPTRAAQNDKTAKRLWIESEKLTGLAAQEKAA